MVASSEEMHKGQLKRNPSHLQMAFQRQCNATFFQNINNICCLSWKKRGGGADQDNIYTISFFSAPNYKETRDFGKS